MAEKITTAADAPLFTITINPSAVDEMTMKQLADLSDALRVASSLVLGLCNYPCFKGRPGLYNEAGDALDDLLSGICVGREAVERGIKSRKPQNRKEGELRLFAVMAAASHYRDSVPVITAAFEDGVAQMAASRSGEA